MEDSEIAKKGQNIAPAKENLIFCFAKATAASGPFFLKPTGLVVQT